MPVSARTDIESADSAALHQMMKRLLWRWGVVMLACTNVGSMAWVVAHLAETGRDRDAWVLAVTSCSLFAWNLGFLPTCLRARLEPHRDAQPSNQRVAIILIGQMLLGLMCRHYTYLEVASGWKHWPGMISAVYAVILVRSRPWLIIALVVPVVAMWLEDWRNGGCNYGLASAIGTACSHMFVAVFSRLAVYAHGQAKQAVDMNEQLRAANLQIAAQADQTALLAVAQERNRLARDIHDALGHSLTVGNAQLAAAAALMPTNPERALEAIRKAQESGHRGLQEIRQSLNALRDSPLDGRSLLEALQQMATAAEHAGMRVSVESAGDERPLPSLVETTLFRCAQEGLTNASRHAQARAVTMSLDFTAHDRVKLSVVDDGPGFSPFDSSPGQGLRGLRERAEALHGSFVSGTAASGGGLCEISIPA